MIINSFGYILSDFDNFFKFWMKIVTVTIQAKSMQKWYFLVINPISKKFPMVFWSLTPLLCQKMGQIGP